MMTFIEDVSSLSDPQLLEYSIKLAHHENEIGLRLIHCLREAERRMIYLSLGYSSLWDYATRHLGLSNGNAQLKIDAMRLSRDSAIAREKIESGELSVTNAAKVNSFFRQEKRAGKTYTSEQKKEVIESVVGLSQSKCERVLLALAPEAIPAEKIRPLTDTKTELKIVVDESTLALLNRLKELLSNQMPDATYADLLEYMAREQLKILEKKQMGVAGVETITPPTGVKSEAAPSNPNEQERTPRPENEKTARSYISVHDRRWVMRRAKGQCEYVSPEGRRCLSRRQLELDHIIPLSQGGRNERGNYRACCKPHNLYYAQMNLGAFLMSHYVPSFR